jgi:hypothetical protein
MANLEELSIRLKPIPRKSVEQGFNRAILKLTGVLHPLRPFQLMVFLNSPEADVSTETLGNLQYAGTYYFYGQGETPQQFAVVQEDRLGFGHPFPIEIEITEALRHSLVDRSDVEVNLVGIDSHGNSVPLTELEIEDLSVDIER